MVKASHLAKKAKLKKVPVPLKKIIKKGSSSRFLFSYPPKDHIMNGASN
jgi:hypothetical protein